MGHVNDRLVRTPQNNTVLLFEVIGHQCKGCQCGFTLPNPKQYQLKTMATLIEPTGIERLE